MGTFGERLQREREMRGITLEEIAEATKIGTRSLRALEEQDFDKLPGGIFNKGFVRAYSKYLGIDEDQAVADYQTAVNEAQAAGKLTRPEVVPPIIVDEADTPEPVRIPWGLMILIALVVAVGFAAKSYYAQHGWAKLRREIIPAQAAKPLPAAPAVNPASTPATANQLEVTPTVEAAQKEPVANPPADPAAPAAEFVVKIHTRDPAWVWMKADGKVTVNETLKANVDREVRAAKEVILVTGNAGGIEVSHNDKVLPALGAAGEKKTVVLNPQGVRQ